jgi:hypothetical protein
MIYLDERRRGLFPADETKPKQLAHCGPVMPEQFPTPPKNLSYSRLARFWVLLSVLIALPSSRQKTAGAAGCLHDIPRQVFHNLRAGIRRDVERFILADMELRWPHGAERNPEQGGGHLW